MNKENKIILPLISFVSIIFIFIGWYVSDPDRAAGFDRYILYNIDDVFRYCFARIAIYDPLVFLNGYAKPLSMLFARSVFFIFPVSIFSLRILNSIMSAGVIYMLFKLAKKMDFSLRVSVLAIMIAVASPLYFIASVSTLSEIMFSLFLISAIYFLQDRKYFLSALLISAAPLIRQEGIFYLILWVFLLRRLKAESKYMFLIFIPALLWCGVSRIVLGHKFAYPLIYSIINTRRGRIYQAPLDLTVPADIYISLISIIIICSPLILGFLDFFFRRDNKKTGLIIPVCILTQTTIIFFNHLSVFFTTGYFCAEFRFIVPVIPLLSISAADFLQNIKRFNFSSKYILVIFFISLLCIFSWQMARLRDISKTYIPFLEKTQDSEIKKSALALDSYLRKNGLSNIYVPAWRTTNQSVRRLWMYLPGDIKYYYFIGKGMIFDMVTNKQQISHSPKGVLVLVDRDEKDLGGKPVTDSFRNKNIMDYDNANLFFYLLD